MKREKINLNILINLEQYGYGGVDINLSNLINSWPRINDEFIIVTNSDNKGKEFHKSLL